jgi:chromosomal replication initiation ATPase DnaA
MAEPRQLPLGLRHAPAMTRADFVTGDANREAVALVDRWPEWPSHVVLITGPAGAGKSHLAAIWQAAAGAGVIAGADVRNEAVAALSGSGNLAVEDIDRAPIDEPALFHLLNTVRERQGWLLLTSRVPAMELALSLPDLQSRLRAAHRVSLGLPDEGLLRRVLVKLFADRQLMVDPAVVDYLVRRMERSFAAASAIVEALDRAALAAGSGVTRALAAEALGEGQTGPDGSR